MFTAKRKTAGHARRFIPKICNAILDQQDLCADAGHAEKLGDMLVIKTNAPAGRTTANLARVVRAVDTVILPSQI